MKVNARILQLISHNVLAVEQYAFSFFQQINSLDSADELKDFITENEEKNAAFFAIRDAEGNFSFADISTPDQIQPGSIFIMSLEGPVMPTSSYGIPGLDKLEAQIAWAVDEPNIDAIVFRLETGGGSVYKLWPFCDAVAAARDKKPIVMFGTGMCASAGIAIATHGSETYSDHNATAFGSIGVMMSYLDIIPWFEAAGCKYYSLNAPGSPDKNKGINDLRQGKEEAMLADLQESLVEFQARVRANRTGIPDSAMTGKMYTSAKAIENKIIDGIATLEQAVSRASELAKSKN